MPRTSRTSPLTNWPALKERQVGKIVEKWMPVIRKCAEIPENKRPIFAQCLEAIYQIVEKEDATADFTRNLLPALRSAFSDCAEVETDLLSSAMLQFCTGLCGSKILPGMTRKTLLDNVLTSTTRPTNSVQMIADQALLAEKLHDKEPELIVNEIEKRCPNFFSSLPRRYKPDSPDQSGPSIAQKKQFLCNYLRHYYHQGHRKYEKPSFADREIRSVQ